MAEAGFPLTLFPNLKVGVSINPALKSGGLNNKLYWL